MTNAKILRKDEFETIFGNKEEMKDFETNIVSESRWDTFPCGDIEVKKCDPVDMDTLQNSGLAVTINGKDYALGKSAVAGLFQTARVSGPALGVLLREGDFDTLTDILNKCIRTDKKNERQYLFRNDKIRAFHSKTYRVVESNEILDAFCEEMDNIGTFEHGIYTQEEMSATSDINDDEVKESYAKVLSSYLGPVGKDKVNADVMLVTSDTANSGCNLYYNVRCGKNEMVLGCGIKMAHKGNASMDKFRDNLSKVLSSYKKSMKNVMDLQLIDIRFPDGCFLNLAKKCDLPMEVAKNCAVSFADIVGNKCTALEVYILGLSSILSACRQESKYGNRQLLVIQEKIARALNLDFKKYDNPYK